jgi:DNA polymerase III epsilon subunit-like protein
LTRRIKCERPELSSPKALEITGKTKADLLIGLPKEEAVEIFSSFLEEDGLTPAHRCIVAHNKAFDMKFVHALYKACGKVFPANMWLCTMEMTRAYAKSKGIIKPKVNLEASLQLMKIAGINRAHNACDDTKNEFLLWEELIKQGVDHLTMIKSVPHILIPESSYDESYDYSFEDA